MYWASRWLCDYHILKILLQSYNLSKFLLEIRSNTSCHLCPFKWFTLDLAPLFVSKIECILCKNENSWSSPLKKQKFTLERFLFLLMAPTKTQIKRLVAFCVYVFWCIWQVSFRCSEDQGHYCFHSLLEIHALIVVFQ